MENIIKIGDKDRIQEFLSKFLGNNFDFIIQ